MLLPPYADSTPRNGTLPIVIGNDTLRLMASTIFSVTVKTYDKLISLQQLIEGAVAGMGNNSLLQLDEALGWIPGP